MPGEINMTVRTPAVDMVCGWGSNTSH